MNNKRTGWHRQADGSAVWKSEQQCQVEDLLAAERAKVALAGVNLEIIAEFSKESEPSSLPQDNSVLHDLCVNALATLQSSDAPPSVAKQIDRLANLPAAWDNDGAESISTAAIKTAKVLVKTAPQVTPTRDGGVQLDWHVEGIDAEVTIAPDGTLEDGRDEIRREVARECAEIVNDLKWLTMPGEDSMLNAVIDAIYAKFGVKQ